MFTALNIDTKEVIATSNDRAALRDIAEKSAGKFGYCIRADQPAETMPSNWATTCGEWAF
jgi:hypothetical protein